MVITTLCLILSAQPVEIPAAKDSKSPVDLALVPAVSVNALQPEHVADNVLALAVLAHRTRHLEGLAIAGGGSWVQGRMRGVQVALFNRAALVEGLQLGAANISAEGLTGVQLSAISSFSLGEARGLQLSMVANLGFEGYTGAQVGLANIVSEQLTGLQVGGLNRAGDVRGAQVGAFNFAGRVTGVMLGLVNIADHADVPVGLINWLGDGEERMVLEGGDTHFGGAGLKLGNSWLFSHLSFGVSRAMQQPRYAFGAGLGARARIDRWLGELEAMVHYTSVGKVANGPAAMQLSLRLNVGFQIMPRLAVLVGPALNLFAPLDTDVKLDGFMPTVSLGGGDKPVLLYPGFHAGLQF